MNWDCQIDPPEIDGCDPEPREEPVAACTAEGHAEIASDAIRREAELVRGGQWHDDEMGVHLQLGHHHCGSTLAWPLPGHRDAR